MTKLRVNCFSVSIDGYGAGPGQALEHPMGIGGMANHSLTPNLRKVFEGERLFLELAEDVPANTEVFFTYTEYAQEAFGLLKK